MTARRSWILVVPILLLAAFLGMQLISADALWLDEWYSYYFTGGGDFLATTVEGTPCEALPGETQTVLHMLCLVVVVDVWPPLHHLLLMGWDILSQGVLLLDRYLSLLFGLLAVAMTYRLVCDLANPRAGIIAALLLAASAFYVHYLHELRGYTLFVFCVAALGWSYWRLLTVRRPGRRLRWGFSFAVAGTLYTHFVGLPIIFGLAIYHLWFERPRKTAPSESGQTNRSRWWLILRAGLNGILIFAPWFAFLLITFAKEADVSRSRGLLNILAEFVYATANGHWLIIAVTMGASLLFLRERPIRFLWVWLAVTAVLLGLGDRMADVLFHARHILGFLPLVLALSAIALDRATQRAPAFTGLAIGLWVGVGIVSSSSPDFMNALPRQEPSVPIAPITAMQQMVATCGRSGDALILGLREPEWEWVQDAPMLYYFGRFPLRIATYSRLLSDEEVTLRPSQLLPREVQTRGVEGRLDYLTESADRVFIMALQDVPLMASTMEIARLLTARGYRPCGSSLESAEMFAMIYGRSAEVCTSLLPECDLLALPESP